MKSTKTTNRRAGDDPRSPIADDATDNFSPELEANLLELEKQERARQEQLKNEELAKKGPIRSWD